MIKTHFVFAVSFVALMAVSSAWAYDPADTSIATDTVATEHPVYENPLSENATGIAGVSYVNKAVNVAGASAQAAEAHAAAAGASAISAAESAAEAAESAASANETLKSKADMDDLAEVARTGSYNDLSDKPTIGNATLTIQKNGAAVDTFTANATSNKSINITVPTKVSELTNDSNYATTTAVNAKQNTLTATGAADRPVYATDGGVKAVTGISIPVGTSTATDSTSWAKIWVE